MIGAIPVMAIMFAIVSYVLVSISLPQSGFRSGRVGSGIRLLASGERCNTAKPQGQSEGLAGIQA